VIIPRRVNGIMVKAIGEWAFPRSGIRERGITSVTIPDSVTSIGDGAFAENQLTSVTFPNSVTFINGLAFVNNPLSNVTIGANVELGMEIEGGFYPAFGNGFENVYNNNGKQAGTYTLNNGVWSLPDGSAFAGGTITSDLFALFEPVIIAYANLERSGYTIINEIIGDSLLAEQREGTYNFGWAGDDFPKIDYSFFDISGNGVSELLIGADRGYGHYISGIYAIQDGKLVSVIQVIDRWNISLLSDGNGNCIIEEARGHMGNASEFFHKIDENGRLITLDNIETNESENRKIRRKYVDGKEVGIYTEEEYVAVLRKYGSSGYESGIEGNAYKIIIGWLPLSAFKLYQGE